MKAVCKMSKEPTTWPCSCRHCPLFFDCLTEYEQAVKKPMTNADRIRAMSDEELAEFFAPQKPTSGFPWCRPVGKVRCGKPSCHECCLAWLQQPAEEVHHE